MFTAVLVTRALLGLLSGRGVPALARHDGRLQGSTSRPQTDG